MSDAQSPKQPPSALVVYSPAATSQDPNEFHSVALQSQSQATANAIDPEK